MKLENYQTLIQNLPVGHQSFTTKKKRWEYAEKSIPWLAALNDQIFNRQEKVTISRHDLLNHTGSLREWIIKIIYWGYPNGMRGNHFINIADKIPDLEEVLEILCGKNYLDSNDYNSAINEFRKINGLGMSTFSKILYFLKIKFNEYPSLILDQRLIDVFRNRIFSDFDILDKMSYDNTRLHYMSYLEVIDQMAVSLNTRGENIEMFLFTFGKNLKTR